MWKKVRWPFMAAFGATLFVALGLWFDWNKSEWASWVQAVGSIAAILAAARIATWQASVASREYEKRRIEAEKAKALAIKYILRRARLVIENAARVLAPPTGVSGPTAYGAAEAPNIGLAAEQVEMVQEALRALPAFEIPSPSLIFALQRTDRDLLYVLKMLRVRVLHDPTRRARTGPDSLFVRIRRRLDEADAACNTIVGDAVPGQR